MDDDNDWMAKVQLGNTEAFGVLYDRYLDKIYRFVYYKTFTREAAEDITSDVFHKALRNSKSFDPAKGSFSTWLYRIARNAVIDHYRTKKHDVPLEDTFDVGVDERTPDALDAIADLGRVTEYLTTLTAKQREIIMLRIWEEKSYREIADIVGGTESSVKMAFSRSIRELREKCGPVSLLVIGVASQVVSALPLAELS